MKKKLLVLTDYRGYFSSKFIGTKEFHQKVNINVDRIKEILEESFEVEVYKYQDIDISKNYNGWYVVYASSEERGLFYKSYIEDVLLKLMYDGAILVPEYKFFRAHGNKSFMEMLRLQFKDIGLRTISSDIYGRLEELDTNKYDGRFPLVIKSSSGSGSLGVKLANNESELKRAVKDLSYVKYNDQFYSPLKDIVYTKIGWKIKTILYSLIKKSQRIDNPSGFFYTNKYLIQNYVPNLQSDFKVLYYNNKYYVLKRETRDNDFRASGSGKFSYPENIEELIPVLDYAKRVTQCVGAPMISMDLALKDGVGYLIEFQCVGFGVYTIMYADSYYEEKNNEWVKIESNSDIELETARSIKEFIKDNYE